MIGGKVVGVGSGRNRQVLHSELAFRMSIVFEGIVAGHQENPQFVSRSDDQRRS